jgi:hypothetical protein
VVRGVLVRCLKIKHKQGERSLIGTNQETEKEEELSILRMKTT